MKKDGNGFNMEISPTIDLLDFYITTSLDKIHHVIIDYTCKVDNFQIKERTWRPQPSYINIFSFFKLFISKALWFLKKNV